jgi:murein DD-endopeptidase MepM/ murein hydrolase activator NlpD
VDSRPSELDPYPRAERDLGSAALWQRSLHRSHRRRIRQRDARRNAPRQKGATLAAGAAILASPVLSPLTGAASASSARPGATKSEVAQKAAVSGEKTWLLSYGDTGEAVASVQQQLQIPADGIFGPQTEGAVKTFQLNHGLAGTGIVDAKTWVEIFGSKVVFYGDADASASSSGAAEKVNVVFGSDAPDAVGGPDLEDRVELRDEIEEAESDPAPAAPETTESEPAPVATGDGCTADGRMVAPVNGTVTGSFGEDRGSHAHSGTDIAAPTGTTVRAAECGTVSMSGTESGYGTMVCIRHAGETTTCYAHLSEKSVGVNEYVKAGQKIGEVGCTGSCTGPHVHFEVRQNGVAEDASPYLQGSKTVGGASTQATSAPMPEGEGGTGGATPEQQAAAFGSTGGAEAPAAEATATTAVPVDEVAPAAPPSEAAPAAEAQATAPAAEAPAPVAEAEATAPATEAPAAEAEAIAPPAETPAPVAEAAAPAEAPAPAVEAVAPPAEAAVEAPAPAPTAEVAVEAPAPAVEAAAPAPAAEAPAPVAEAAPAPVAEAQPAAPVADASAEVTGGVAAP